MAQDYILKFDISMNNLMFMHVADSFQHLSCNNRSSLFRQRFMSLKQLKQMPVFSQLQQQVNVRFVTEKGVEFDQVGVGQERLDFDLADELVQGFLVLFCSSAQQICFSNYFQSSYKTCLLMSS